MCLKPSDSDIGNKSPRDAMRSVIHMCFEKSYE